MRIIFLCLSILLLNGVGLSQHRGSPVETTPTMANATSVTMAAAKPDRSYLLIQNNSAGNICCSMTGNTLTGIAPTSTNKCFVLIPGASFESNANYVSTYAITCYQASGGSINTVYVAQG